MACWISAIFARRYGEFRWAHEIHQPSMRKFSKALSIFDAQLRHLPRKMHNVHLILIQMFVHVDKFYQLFPRMLVILRTETQCIYSKPSNWRVHAWHPLFFSWSAYFSSDWHKSPSYVANLPSQWFRLAWQKPWYVSLCLCGDACKRSRWQVSFLSWIGKTVL